MDTRLRPDVSRSDVATTETAARVTPSAAVPFRDFVTRGAATVVRGAEQAVTSLPGGSLVAAAVRNGAVGAVTEKSGSAALTGTLVAPTATAPIPSGVGGGSAENPLTGAPSSEAPSVEQSLAQSQAFNLYYLQLQEQLSAENRSYTAMSNVLKARHDTVKNAIGNIR